MTRTALALRSERGTSSIEVALVLPVVLLALLGAVQLALVSHAQAVISTAAHEGARVAASESASPQAGAARARQVLASGLGAGSGGYAVSVGTWGDTVVAQVSGSYPLLIPWLGRRSAWLHTQAEARKEVFRAGP